MSLTYPLQVFFSRLNVLLRNRHSWSPWSLSILHSKKFFSKFPQFSGFCWKNINVCHSPALFKHFSHASNVLLRNRHSWSTCPISILQTNIFPPGFPLIFKYIRTMWIVIIFVQNTNKGRLVKIKYYGMSFAYPPRAFFSR